MAEKSVAVIAAGGGKIGGCIARELAARGHALVLMSSGGSAEALARELGGTGLTGSVAEPADLARLVETAMDAHGRIDAVVNNTGHVPKGSGSLVGPFYKAEDVDDLIAFTDAQWHDSLDRILLNVVRMARLVTPIMRRQGGGAILNISSFAQKEPSPKFPIGAALRMAMAGYMKLYADRYARDGIRMKQPAAWLRRLRSPARGGGPQHPHEPRRHPGGNGQDRRLPAVFGRGLHHRPEHPCSTAA